MRIFSICKVGFVSLFFLGPVETKAESLNGLIQMGMVEFELVGPYSGKKHRIRGRVVGCKKAKATEICFQQFKPAKNTFPIIKDKTGYFAVNWGKQSDDHQRLYFLSKNGVVSGRMVYYQDGVAEKQANASVKDVKE